MQKGDWAAEIDPTRVAVYIRWSTEDQGEGTTLEVQMETCKAYLLSQGWSPSPELVFVDDGYSGGSLDRPAINRLRAMVQQGLVHCVVVYKLDRLSRSVVDTVNLVCREWEGKCSIKSAREPIDTTSHAGRMFFYTLVNYAEWERSVIRERTYSGKLRRAREGRNPGMRPPYGYALGEGGVFTVLPGEAATVQRIYNMYLSGMGARMIVGELNRSGSRPRLGRAWTQSSVIRILSNPAYVGRLEYGRRQRGGQGRRATEPAVVTDKTFIPPIVALADWEMVQSVKAGRPGFGRGNGTGRTNTSESMLTGLLRCRCGHSFTGKAMVGRYRYYRCLGTHTKGSHFCPCASVRQEAVDDQVIQELRRQYGGAEVKERLVHRVLAHWQRQLEEARGSVQSARRELGHLESAHQRLRKLLRDGELSVAEYRELRTDLEAESAGLTGLLERAEAQEREALAGIGSQSRLLAALDEIDAWESLTHLGRKQLLRQFVQEVRLYKGPGEPAAECQIIWRWATEAPADLAE